MSVPESQRGESKFEVFVKAQGLAVYTIKICTNQNVFPTQYQNALTNDIIRTSKDIFIDCWTANNILVRVPKTETEREIIRENFRERRRLQERAARSCNNLLALMQIAQTLFHLSTKRIKYWGEMTIETRDLIRKWRESDQKREKQIETR